MRVEDIGFTAKTIARGKTVAEMMAPYREAPVRRGAFCDSYRRESETVASATLGRSQDVFKGAIEGGRCVVSS